VNGRAAQRGFTLLETLVATALTATLILSVSAAVLGSLHATVQLGERAELTDHALNILSDLRETTAYNANALAAMTGRTVTTTFRADATNARVLTATIGVALSGPSGPVVASVTVADPNGESVTEQQTLFVEAPAPGSVIEQATPTPAAGG
jgi:prepilin-type N-terminal cleavage/methylation domain-containing protein